LADTGELYDTVQEAENAASAFVFVPPGTFTESVTINTSGMTLLGCGNATTINGSTVGTAITSNASNITIENLSVKTTAGAGNSIHAIGTGASSTELTVKSVTVTESDNNGIFITNGTDNIVINCTVENCDANGIQFNGTSPVRNRVIGNTLINCAGDGSIKFGGDQDDGVISHNMVFDSQGNNGIVCNGNDNTVGSNRVDNSPGNGIFIGGIDNILYNNRISDSSSQDIDNNGTNTTLDGNLTGASN
jgi:hypothetical protein